MSNIVKALTNWMRSIKDWTESFAQKPYAMSALFIMAFAESSFFPVPPDVLLIAIAVSAPAKSLRAALWCSVGSVFGGILGYYIGYGLMESVGRPIIDFYNGQDAWASFLQMYEDYGIFFLAGAAFSPIPYKISTIASGAAQMDITTFIIVSSLGRAARFFLVGGLIYWIGPKVRVHIDKYFDKLALLFILLLIGGFAAVKLLF